MKPSAAPAHDPEERRHTVGAFNRYIIDQDLDGFDHLMTEDHPFVDSTGQS